MYTIYMLGIFQRIIQILFISLLVLIAIKPNLAPVPLQPYTRVYSRFVIGDSVSFKSFTHTWTTRWQSLVAIFPQLKTLKAPWPEPPEKITGDWIMQMMASTFVQGPLDKWEKLSHELITFPFSSSTSAPSSGSADIKTP